MAREDQLSKTPPPPQSPVARVDDLLNPHGNPAAYLTHKGWRCLGNPEWESALWMDPTQPLVGYYTEEPCMYSVEVREEYADPDTGQVKVRYKVEQRQILAQDGRGGASVAARRAVYHPKGVPLKLTGALEMQLERDARDTLQAEDRKRKEEEATAKGKK